MKLRFRFGRRPQPAPEAVPEPPLAGLEREIAIGSLSGIAPTEVRAHLVLVVDNAGGLKISGAACDELAVTMLTHAATLISKRILAGHKHR